MCRRDFAMECRIIQACDAFPDSYITGMERIRIPAVMQSERYRKGIMPPSMTESGGNPRLRLSIISVGTAVKMSNQAEGIVVLQTEDPEVSGCSGRHSGESEKNTI